MLPNLSDYMQTFQNPKYFLSDKELASCTCPKDQQGQPKVQSGGFALTFQLERHTKKWAVRCFHREVKDRDCRYNAISAKLNDATIKESGYFVDFAYQPLGVTVKGQKYPIVKMSWAQGVTLGTFLESNYNNPQGLMKLQDSLKRLYRFLKKNHIAHGDIQPGNLMVSENGGKVQLIDYDGMFVPGMEKLKAAETGVPNFQHPARRKLSPWNDRLDRFPFIMLDIALSVLKEKPSYWTKTNSSDEKVLFEANDYIAPYGSQTFKALKADVKFSKQIAVLQQICNSGFDDIPDAENYLGFSSLDTPQAQQPQTISISYQSNYAVLDATNVTQIASHVGDKVEIIGKIISTRDGYTYDNSPYMFVNFIPWCPGHDTFQLVLWSEVISQYAEMGVTSVSDRIKGQYISIVGLVNVYKCKDKRGIVINYFELVPSTANQIQIIDKTEADFRLGKKKKPLRQSFGGTKSAPACSPTTTTRDPAQRPTRVIPGSPRPQPSPPPPNSNVGKLKCLQGQWDGGASSMRSKVSTAFSPATSTPHFNGSTASGTKTPSLLGSKVSTASSPTTSTHRSSGSTTSGTETSSSSGSDFSGCLGIIIVAVILFRCCGG